MCFKVPVVATITLISKVLNTPGITIGFGWSNPSPLRIILGKSGIKGFVFENVTVIL